MIRDGRRTQIVVAGETVDRITAVAHAGRRIGVVPELAIAVSPAFAAVQQELAIDLHAAPDLIGAVDEGRVAFNLGHDRLFTREGVAGVDHGARCGVIVDQIEAVRRAGILGVDRGVGRTHRDMLTQVAVIVVLEAAGAAGEARSIDIDLPPEGVVASRLARARVDAIGAIARARLEHILIFADQEITITSA
ncbi:hypothetical protein D3C80_846060 [compost metagenome]